MSKMPKAYEPQKYEDKIYKSWEEGGFFQPEAGPPLADGDDIPSTRKPYAISMPPPNVTGVLHLGHALENSIMDIEARYQRMQGKRVLLVPGTDHAAVATQAKVEKILIEQGMKNPRQELGREKLLQKIREFAEDSKTTILKQIRTMGTSCDWSRLAYTFDEERSKAVNEVFVKMHKDGLIEKGYRVVNWSVKGQSTCSDDELEHKERKTILYTFKYSENFPISIATTRPETKLGDTAVAVNPDDKRYKKYIGKTFTVDIQAEKPLKIKIIADKEIDPYFGTGALGVTPAHSMIDYEMMVNHNLDIIKVIGEDGRMTKEAGENYSGLTVIEAREKFVAWLKKEGLLEKQEEIVHNVGTSDRFKDVVEVIPMEQWFVMVNKEIPGRGKTLKDLMREVVTTGLNNDKKKHIKITPDRFEKQYLRWIDNLRDWCISRQVWWGHRIPVWYKSRITHHASHIKNDEIYCGVESPEGDGWVQDEDTLDTWFSSGLWTFSTLGWPEETKDFKEFHPTAWMQMGYEILFFWMARMILMSTYALNDIPFKNVYIHGILRDKNGQKFSKSLGNGIDPIEVSKEYGTDALRLSLILGNTPGNDSRFYEEKVESARNLVNKIWNISRYILSTCHPERIAKDPGNGADNSGSSRRFAPQDDSAELTLADSYILSELNNIITEVTNDIDSYNFSQAGEKLREFTRDTLANWYLEATKFQKGSETEKILLFVLENLLKLWHPFIPFVTEAIWKEMGKDNIIVAKWPTVAPLPFDEGETERGFSFSIIMSIISAIRNARAENKVEPSKKVRAIIIAGDHSQLIEDGIELIKGMRTGISDLSIVSNLKSDEIQEENTIKIVSGDITIYLLGAKDEAKEKMRIAKRKAELEKVIKVIKNKLDNKKFVENAPQEVVEKEKERLEGFENELNSL